MDQAPPTIHRLFVYTTEMRWTGYIPPAPSYRRLSDHINDKNIDNLLLSHAIPARWENGTLVAQPEMASAYIRKSHTILVGPTPDSPPPPPAHPMNKVPKNPFRVMIYLPTLHLDGYLHFGRSAAWPEAFNTLHSDFLPVTDATIWHTPTGKEAGKESFVLINREHIIALEPLPMGA
ncbi:MAG: hypothetical protein WCF84_01665 [Anaerolineae bacterium]